MAENINNIRILNIGTVIDTEDPKMANRVRVSFDLESNIALLNSIPDTSKGKRTKNTTNTDLQPEFKWTEIDPFCVLPLLPIFINVLPKLNESVQIIYPITSVSPRNSTHNEQYYVPGPFSSPLTISYENNNSQRGFASKINIKNAVDIKNPVNNEYNVSADLLKGVFIEPSDIGIQSRGTTDVVLKQNDVLLRAGKSKEIPDDKSKFVTANLHRSFVQLSNFTSTESLGPEVTKNSIQVVDENVKLLVEWNIINPENTQNVFTIEVYLYKLVYNNKYSTKLFSVDTEVSESDKSLIQKYSFASISQVNAENIIIGIIKGCNDGTISVPNYPKLDISYFPFYYRPSKSILKIFNSQSPSPEYTNVISFFNQIKILNQNGGYGLVSAKDVAGIQLKTVKTVEKDYIVSNTPVTYNVQGADKLIFISHINSGKYQINWDDPNSLYGIEQSYIINNILPKTSATVRGDELISFLNYLTRFLISHVHSFPGIPPVPVGTDGSNVSELLARLTDADNTILNQNIRIN